MKVRIASVTLGVFLSVTAAWAAPEDARFGGGTFDGWDLNDTIYGDLGITATVSLSSGSNQVFDWSQASAALAAVTITTTEPAGTITNGGTLRVSVPGAWLCRFDTGSAVTYAGNAAGKAGVASFSGDGRTLQIPVTADFVAGNTLMLSGLKLVDLRLVPASSSALGLDFTGSPAADKIDLYTVRVRVQWTGGSYDGWDLYAMAESAILTPLGSGIFIQIQ